MNHKLNCALIGRGYWGKILERYLVRSEYFNLRYIYDPALINGISMEKILEDVEIDAAFVSTPIDTHFDIVKELLNHGKHVFCEKPMTKTLKSAQELAALAVDKGLCLYTDYIYTVSPSVNYLRERICRIGNILSIDGEIRQFGSFYINDSVEAVLGVHLISAILYLLDVRKNIEVNKVRSFRSNAGNALDMEMELSCEKVLTIKLSCDLVSEIRSRKLNIKGERGNLYFDMLGEYTARQVLVERQNPGYIITENEGVKFDEGNNLQIILGKFYQEIENKSNGNLELSLMVTDIIEHAGFVIHG